MKRIKSILFFMLITVTVNAQEDVQPWTLHDCIDYALEHNIRVKKSENDIRLSIIRAYTQVLYAIESVHTNENTVEVSRVHRDRGKNYRRPVPFRRPVWPN
jgi:hypothetical protein